MPIVLSGLTGTSNPPTGFGFYIHSVAILIPKKVQSLHGNWCFVAVYTKHMSDVQKVIIEHSLFHHKTKKSYFHHFLFENHV